MNELPKHFLKEASIKGHILNDSIYKMSKIGKYADIECIKTERDWLPVKKRRNGE
jgi:hypothetical protein